MRSITVSALLLASAGSLAAQGTITDNTATFTVSNVATSPTSASGTGNFAVGGGADAVYQSWWYYRDAGGAGGAFNNAGGQLTQNYVGSLGTMTWTDVDALSLYDASLVMIVSETGPSNGNVTQAMTITNRTANLQTISVYHYVDFDYGGTTVNWTLPGSGSDRFIVTAASPQTSVRLWRGGIDGPVQTGAQLDGSRRGFWRQ